MAALLGADVVAAPRPGCGHPVGVHLQPGEQVGGLGRRRPRCGAAGSRSVAHSACQAPSARSSTASAAARCRVAASCGVVSAARRTSTERTGLALCGIVDDPPPAPSDELADLGPAEGEDVVGDPAPARRCSATSGVAERG